MINFFLGALTSQMIILAAGTAILQIISFRKRISFWSSLPAAWGIGVVFLYMTGYAFIKTGQTTDLWKAGTLAAAAILSVSAGWIFKKNTPTAETIDKSEKLSWYQWLLVIAIALKIAVITYILLNNPVIDSDATNPNRWIGLAKYIQGTGHLPVVRDRFGPSVLPLWVSIFLPRWHDSMISLPWLSTYIAFLGMTFITSCRLTGSRTAALAIAYIYSAIPLAAVHVIRPGYSDFLLGFYVLLGFSPLCEAMYRKTHLSVRQTVLIFSGCVLCTLTKNEGIAWALLILIIAAGYLYHSKRAVPMKTILMTQAAVILGCYLLYLLTGKYLFQLFKTYAGHLRYVFVLKFKFKALNAFSEHVFTYGSFSIFWWLTWISALSLLVKKSTVEAKIIVFYSMSFFLAVFYIALFTGNVQATVVGGNVLRFLLQICGTAVPVLGLFVKEILRPVKDTVQPRDVTA